MSRVPAPTVAVVPDTATVLKLETSMISPLVPDQPA